VGDGYTALLLHSLEADDDTRRVVLDPEFQHD
jgi:hypothetical protein